MCACVREIAAKTPAASCMSVTSFSCSGAIIITIHHHCGAVVSRGWANGSAFCFHICQYCATLCQMVHFQYPSCSSFRRSLDLFPSWGFQVIRDVHRLPSIMLTCHAHVYFRLLVQTHNTLLKINIPKPIITSYSYGRSLLSYQMLF